MGYSLWAGRPAVRDLVRGRPLCLMCRLGSTSRQERVWKTRRSLYALGRFSRQHGCLGSGLVLSRGEAAVAARTKYHGRGRNSMYIRPGRDRRLTARPMRELHPQVFCRGLVEEGARGPSQPRSPSRLPCPRVPVSIFSAKPSPERTFDVGIAEQHAVTFDGGTGVGGDEALRGRSIPPSSSAPTTRSSTTWRSRSCRFVFPDRPGRLRRRGRPDPLRGLRRDLSGEPAGSSW